MSYTKIEKSLLSLDGSSIVMVRDAEGNRYLQVEGDTLGLTGQLEPGIFPLSAENAAVLREKFSWLNPQPLGLKISAGTGDRLGLATPGHALAFEGTGVAPIFAQQSVRENVRTHRTPRQVMDDAMWGVVEAGWKDPWGADGDHLKTPEDAKAFFEAGFTFYTVDPGEHVQEVAEGTTEETLKEALESFDFNQFQTSLADIVKSYSEKSLPVEGVTCSEADILTALQKYGRAILHVQKMFTSISGFHNGKEFDFEVSVDETDWPTSVFEHYFIVNELRRLGIRWTSLAPRFIGRFEKGVDYIGDLKAFEAEYKIHAAIQKHFGTYKMSLHSGSDKFSIYKICVTLSEHKVHLKTAGTSYLEALRVLSNVSPDLFREIYAFSRGRYDTDKVSYHVSAEFAKMPDPTGLTDAQLPSLLDDFHARQALHVCFGSVLDLYGKEVLSVLKKNSALYDQTIKKHFDRHLADFSTAR